MGLGHFRQLRPHGRLTLCERAACALVALLALAAVPAPAFAQYTASDTETVQARIAILTQGTMTKLEDIEFGNIVQPVTAGTVVLAPTANPACGTTGGVLVRTGPCQSALFSVRERKKGLVRIREMNGGTVVLTGAGGATMNMTNLTLSVTDLGPCSGSGNGNCNNGNGNGNGNAAGTLGRYEITSDSGFAYFRIGGTLHVGANQQVGVYHGTLNIEVLFN